MPTDPSTGKDPAEGSREVADHELEKAQRGRGSAGAAGKSAPGDDASPETPGTGEDICPECRGSGKLDAKPCRNCNGTGRVTKGIGGG